MRISIVGLLLAALVAFTGCNNDGTPGGPGVTSPATKRSGLGKADDTFSLDVPNLSTRIKQGETRAVAIAINRGKNFDEDVTLKFANVPTGVAIDPASPIIKHGDKEARFTIKAADDAAVGEFVIKVTGHPSKGSDASNEFNLTVAKK